MKLTNLQKRVLAVVVYFPALLLSCFDSHLFAGFISFLLFVSWHEYLSFRSVPGDTFGWFKHFSICLLGSLPAVLMMLGYESLLGFAVIFIYLQLLIIQELVKTNQWKDAIQKPKELIVGWIYITTLFSFLLYLQAKGGPQSLLFLFLVVGACDTGAYFGGRFLGRTPFFPAISPKKTLEGFYTGLISSAIVALVFAMFVKKYDYTAPSMILSILLGAAVGFASVFGDLFESSMKRHFGVKDSGQIIPGHGGVLDRFDGVLFGAVPLFFYVVLFGGFK